MKKYGICVLGMICLLGFTGCGGAREDQEKDAQETREKDVQENQDQEKDVQETRDTGEENAENDNSIADGQEVLETPDTAAVNSETAVYSQDDIYMSVDIPNGWDYRIRTKEDMEKEDGLTSCAIDFWPEDYPETVFELGYAQQFGICGTGVTIEEFTLENGISGYRYTEEIEDILWLTVTLNDSDNDAAIKNGTYLISASPELSVWESIKTEFDKILESVWVGSLGSAKETDQTD